MFSLICDENEIKEVDLFGNKTIKFLSLNKNKMTNCKGMNNLKALEELLMQENEINDLSELQDLPVIRKIDLTGNKLESLSTLQTLENVETLILEGNPIAKLDDLKFLCKLKNLTELNMKATPISDEKGEEFKKEVLIICEDLKKLKVINEDKITPDDIRDAMNLKEERIREAMGKPPVEEGGEGAEPGEEAPQEDE